MSDDITARVIPRDGEKINLSQVSVLIALFSVLIQLICIHICIFIFVSDFLLTIFFHVLSFTVANKRLRF